MYGKRGTDAPPKPASYTAMLQRAVNESSEVQATLGIGAVVALLFLWKVFFSPTKKALKKDKFIPFELAKKEKISHDTVELTFKNPLGEDAILGECGKHL